MTIRVASVQMQHKDYDVDYNLETVENFVKQAARDKVDIITFPECCMVGYMCLEKLSLEEIFLLSQPLDGYIFSQIKNLAKRYNIIISVGMLERDIEENIYNTYITVDSKRLMNSFRKLHPFINPAIKPGNEFKVFDILGWKASTLICYDMSVIPENSRAVALLGAEIVFTPQQTGAYDYPHAGMGTIFPDLWINRHNNPKILKDEFLGPKGREWRMKWLPARAYDNAIYIVYSNGVGLDGPEVRTGNACIVDPNGIVLAETNTLGDDMVIADCDQLEVKKAEGILHKQSRRPTLYKIICSGEEGQTEKVWEAKKRLDSFSQ